MTSAWKTVIGLEVHAQLRTRSKLFSAAPNAFGGDPNTKINEVDLGLPGSLPVVNRAAVELALRAALALGCEIQPVSRFARKHYFYPDLPKGYQISQYEEPYALGGSVPILKGGELRRVPLTRIHMEEDAGKSIHDDAIAGRDSTHVDLNRAGVPLIEIVSEPTLTSAEEASAYLRSLRAILRCLEVSDADMEKGQLRCDANVSIRPEGDPRLGTKVELKNINSFRFLEQAIDHEVERQIELLEEGGSVRQETRHWDERRGESRPSRSKEDADDYRYFPDPDLLPLRVDADWIERVRADLPELPIERRLRYESELGVPAAQAEVISDDRVLADFFEATLRLRNDPKTVSNWVMRGVREQLEDGLPKRLTPSHLADLLELLDAGRVTAASGRELLAVLAGEGGEAEATLQARGLEAVGSGEELESVVQAVLDASPKQVSQYREGDHKVTNFLMGRVMKQTKGKADPAAVRRILERLLATLLCLVLAACSSEEPTPEAAPPGEPTAMDRGPAEPAPGDHPSEGPGALPRFETRSSGPLDAPDAPDTDAARGAAPVARVGARRLLRADAEPWNWLSHGRTYAEQRYSPLASIDDTNVTRLAPVWRFETGQRRGHEATPIVVDGVMFVTSSWSIVFALDARSGEELWRFDPKVSPETGQKACCDVVNRGVAVYRGKVYAGALDGRLFALDAATGEVVWQVVTVDQSKPYTVTGAPRIVKGRVIIGNGGAEFGVRGYVSAYDAETGELAWRTYTVPGDPSKPFESPAMERAAKTWKGGEWWKIGGGGTAWDAIAFDPELDLLYVGTGNGSPWTRHIRSPGGGDNLYLSSILALDPDSGELVWHYQTTPGDNWDFTATQQLVLAELSIGGRLRKVVMQAPKNGFFYVLDRETGELISAEKYVTVTWAERVDKESGRPVEVAGQDYRDELAVVMPTAFGGHNWHPMAFNPDTGLVYIPAQEIVGAYRLDPDFVYRPGEFNTGTDMNVFALSVPEAVSGHLLAWDPIAQREVWRQPYALPWNGGTLTTAGNLVFQGTADGRFVAYRADDGRKLWEWRVGTGVVAGPVTWSREGVQYVTVVVGWGGAFALAGGAAAAAAGVPSEGAVLTFALGREPPRPQDVEARITQPGERADGERLYHAFCARCHGGGGVSAGLLPDLREMSPEVHEAFDDIVLRGAFAGKGMPAFASWLRERESRLIRSYLVPPARP